MPTRIKYTGNSSVRRYPRTLQEAFPRDHALWLEQAHPHRTMDTLAWIAALALLVCTFFAPTLWRYFNG